MNIYKTGNSECEISIDHYRNVCKNATFSIQVIEKLPWNGYKNGAKSIDMLGQQLTHQEYWMKTLCTV